MYEENITRKMRLNMIEPDLLLLSMEFDALVSNRKWYQKQESALNICHTPNGIVSRCDN